MLVVVAVVVTVVVRSRRTDTADAATPANTAPGTEGTAFVVADAAGAEAFADFAEALFAQQPRADRVRPTRIIGLADESGAGPRQQFRMTRASPSTK